MENGSDVQGQQQHPISLYFKVWGLLFVLSGFSYAVDYLQVQGELRWALIIIFMFLKSYSSFKVFSFCFFSGKFLLFFISGMISIENRT